jgi:hypothetical protein
MPRKKKISPTIETPEKTEVPDAKSGEIETPPRQNRPNRTFPIITILFSAILIILALGLLLKAPEIVKAPNIQKTEMEAGLTKLNVTTNNKSLTTESHTLLDIKASQSKKGLIYIILSGKDNSYILALSEDAAVRERIKTKELRIGQSVTINVSKPISFKREPQEVSELKKKLKRVKLVMLKSIEPINKRQF